MSEETTKRLYKVRMEVRKIEVTAWKEIEVAARSYEDATKILSKEYSESEDIHFTGMDVSFDDEDYVYFDVDQFMTNLSFKPISDRQIPREVDPNQTQFEF